MTVTEPTDLDRKVAAGDEITDADLEAAERAERKGRLARLRERSATNRAAREAERARVERIAALDRLIHTRFGEHEGGIVAAFDAAVEALVPFVQAVAEHNDALRTIHQELDSLAPLPAELRLSTGSTIHLPAEDVFIHPIDPAQLASDP